MDSAAGCRKTGSAAFPQGFQFPQIISAYILQQQTAYEKNAEFSGRRKNHRQYEIHGNMCNQSRHCCTDNSKPRDK